MLPEESQFTEDPQNTPTVESDFTPPTSPTSFAERPTSQFGDNDYSEAALPEAFRTVPERMGRFEIQDRIGEGGMGTVYRAIDTADGAPAAVKVLRVQGKSVAGAVRRFRKEARLLADVQNDHVTRLIEVGEDAGFHYLAMELIVGIDLKSWLKPRKRLDEKAALALVADIARALVDAHAKQVIHRDIKPENVLLQFTGEVPEGTADGVSFIDRPLSDFRVKLTDFGIARHVNQTESMEMTRAGMIIGTPRYMAPEQFDTQDGIGPAADVYSLGVTLFEILTGGQLFRGKDMMELASRHRHEQPPSVQVKRAEISDMTATLVDRTLAKEPAKRFGDAEQLLTAIERIRRGDAVPLLAHPKSPEAIGNPVWEKTKTWDLQSSPEQLWRFVSNTERLNHALGFPAVTYTTKKDETHGLRKFGNFKLAGVKIAWEEHPFEWLEGKRMGILREFTSGPFRWFLSVVTLEPLPGGGTRLAHQVRIEAKNLVGRLMTTMEADWKGFRNLDRVYRRIDRALLGKLKPDEGADAFAKPDSMTSAQQTRLEERIEQMIDDGVAPQTAKKLREVIATWAAQEIAQIRPLRLADTLAVEGQSMIDACLIAASRGLLQLRWDILCPTCRAPASTNENLSEIQTHTQCEACDVAFQSNVSNAIEMVFRVHPELRNVNDQQYCIGGPEHSPHVVAQLRLEPGERLEMQTSLNTGDYLLRGPQLPRTQPIRVRDSAAPSSHEITLSMLGEGVAVPVLRCGQQTITMTNDTDHLKIIRLERMISRDDVVTATAAAAMPRFRQLFPDQSFNTDNPVSTEEVTLLATCINNIDDVYTRHDDAAAYAITQQWVQQVRQIVTSEGGALTKTMGEKSLAAFLCREQAVRAAIRLRLESVASGDESLQVGIAVHSGPTLVTTENDRLDYFGGSVRAVNALAEMADGDTLLTRAVYADTEVKSIMPPSDSTALEEISLPGMPNTAVCRIRVDQTCHT